MSRKRGWRPDDDERDFWRQAFKYWRQDREEWERVKEWLYEEARRQGMIKNEKNFQRLVNMMRQYWEEGPAKVKRPGYKLLQLLRERMKFERNRAEIKKKLRKCFATIEELLAYAETLPKYVIWFITYDPENRLFCISIEPDTP